MSAFTTTPGPLSPSTTSTAKPPIIRLPSFKAYVFGMQAHRRYLWLTLTLSLAQFIAFKLCYPYPDFISDSYNYIETAQYHLNVNIWPVAYGKFLALVHFINPSDLFLVAIQYVLLQAALLYFFFSVKYLFRPAEGVASFLFIALLCNPMFIYLSNAVLSDSLFAAISTVWLTILLWQLHMTNRIGLLIQVLLLGIAFMLRYAALYYPLAAALVLLQLRLRPVEKVAWMAAPALLIIPFVQVTKVETKKYTGTAEFSVFSGWQIANNALYMYGNIKVDLVELPAEMRPLDTMMKRYYQDEPPEYFNFVNFPGTFFIKHPESPLKQYRNLLCRKSKANPTSFLAWGTVSPLYSRYGNWLICHYPFAFTKYYLWLNIKRYFYPFPEKFKEYNFKVDFVENAAQQWFHWSTPHIHSISATLPHIIFYLYPAIFTIMNLYFFGCIIWLFVTGNFRRLDPGFRKALLFITGFQLLHFAFSVLATPVCLRHHITPMLFLFVFCVMLLEFLDKERLLAISLIVADG